MYVLSVALLLLVLVAPVEAEVRIDIGIHLPAPPRLVVVPQVPAVQYVPAVEGNLFFYNRQYWAFAGNGWYVSSRHAGPWILVAPQFVPRPVLLVPVQYYRVPPGHWKKWKHTNAPRWQDEYGGEWSRKRNWKHDDRDDDRGRGKGRGRGRGHGRK
jgi:hypothetical protein